MNYLKQKEVTMKQEKRSALIQALDNRAFVRVWKDLNLVLGYEVNLYLAILIEKYNYYYSKSALTEDGYFFVTKASIEYETGLPQTNQSKISEKLETIGLIKTKMQGVPPKKFFKINDSVLDEFCEVVDWHKLNFMDKYRDKETGRIWIDTENLKEYKEMLKTLEFKEIKPYDLKGKYIKKQEEGFKIKIVKEKVSNRSYVPTINHSYVPTINHSDVLTINHSDVLTINHSDVLINNSNKNIDNKNIDNKNIIIDNLPPVDCSSSTKISFNRESILKNIVKKDIPRYEELLEKEFSEIMKLFRKHNLKSINFQRGSKTPELLYKFLKTAMSGELKKEVNKKQRDDLKDYTKLDKPKDIDRFTVYVKRALQNLEIIRTDENYFPKDKSIVLNLTATNFMCSYNKKFSWFLHCLNDPQPGKPGKQAYQLSAVTKKLESMKINKTFLLSKVYNNGDGAHAFTPEQWEQVQFSAHSVIKYIEQNEADLMLTGGYYPPKQALRLIGEWHLSQSQMFPDFGVSNSGPWQWFNKWMLESRGHNFLIDEKRLPALRELEERKRIDEARKYFNECMNKLFEKYGFDSNPDSEVVKMARQQAIEKYPDIDAENFKVVKG